jgi:hypothetical protein
LENSTGVFPEKKGNKKGEFWRHRQEESQGKHDKVHDSRKQSSKHKLKRLEFVKK